MNRNFLEKNNGMVFIFPAPMELSFWMKNTLIPLDIAFVDESHTILNIEQMKPLDENTTKSKGKALYAIEANLNWFQENNIKVGDKVKLNYSSSNSNK